MERLTKHSKQTSHENGICCTHFRGPECLEVGGNCAMNCKWEEAAWSRLAAYEDMGWTPEEIEQVINVYGRGQALRTENALRLEAVKDISTDRLRELAEADKDGRLVVLPCKPDGSMLNTSDPERPEIMKRIHFAVAYVCGGIVFHQPYNIFIENVAAGYIRPLNEEAEKALEAMKNE